MEAKQILHYKILEKIGEGGMGIVYLAEDTKLKRNVAIKFLPRHISENGDERKRFEIEAQAAAALNHPNIATIHAIEEADDEMFIVMEYIDGVELKDKLKSGPLSVAEALNLALQIARGLEAAHEKNIIHRDIKSSNIMITEKGQIKIMDFGLAKMRGSLQVTREGTTVGTVVYMSPEQARGNEVDQRTDIWSFGVLLYELLTGRLPFKGDYEQAVIYSIVNEQYESMQLQSKDIPGQLEKVVARLLEKNTENRYQQIHHVIDDLRTSVQSSSLPAADLAQEPVQKNYSKKKNFSAKSGILLAVSAATMICIFGYLFVLKSDSTVKSLAVLPFINAGNDPDTEYLSDGITAGLINRLSEIPELKVMSRHSVVRFKDGQADPLTAGRILGVEIILTGRLNIRDEKLLVNVDLIKAGDGQQLWGDRFERDRGDILKIEQEIVKRIGNEMKVRLAGQQSPAEQSDHPIDPVAYDNYLRGRYIMLGTSDDGPLRAQEYFRQAIEREPRLALAYAGLGESYVNQAWLSSRNRAEILPLAQAALTKAMELDQTLSEAHVLAGDIALYFDWDWSAAEAAYRKAIGLKPGSDLAHRELGSFLSLMDQPDEAIAEARIAQSLDPLSVYATHQLGYSLMVTGRLSEAAAEFSKAIDLNPTWVWGNIKMGMAYALMGESAKATAAMNRADELLAGKLPSPLAQDWLAQIAYLCGDKGRMTETLKRLKNQEKYTYIDPVVFADIYYRSGEFDKMIQSLEYGYSVRSTLMVYLFLQTRFIWKQIADDPRYLSLLERMNFPIVAKNLE